MVYLPMGYLYGKRFSAELDPLIESLREELYAVPYSSIDWPRQRNHVAQADLYAPHTHVVDALFKMLGYYEKLPVPFVRQWGMDKAYKIIVKEDENTGYQCLGPVNKMLNFICRWIVEGADSKAMELHREKLKDFAWMSGQGLMMTGTNGSQLWDTSFIGQAMVDSGLIKRAEYQQLALRILNWLDQCQIRENPRHYRTAYRFATKGAWPFSTREQGYTVSDCTAEGLKAVLMLQNAEEGKLGHPVSKQRLRDTIDLLLTMQNPGGGYASYETINGPEITEWLNPAEVFGRIMVEYAYPECTTSVVTGLRLFQQYDTYRSKEIDETISRAVRYILHAQRQDGSWYGSWAICFTYAAMFALESLRHAGLNYENNDQVRKACQFLLSKQQSDGGWGESYKCPDSHAIERGVHLIMQRQQPDGSWKQEQIEGIFNQYVCRLTQQLYVAFTHLGAISYPNYKFSFTIWALGKAAQELGL
ncbi:lanosterol synthase [Malassezia yamatoensis]|uniref:lanosterol synthase n=1 Tax=Malassezia yamatoensis TaxID=253288 RepID=A0AAJ5YRW8_9BASI|nr:lanosterol synthase [Malassezia yamatoensis]